MSDLMMSDLRAFELRAIDNCRLAIADLPTRFIVHGS